MAAWTDPPQPEREDDHGYSRREFLITTGKAGAAAAAAGVPIQLLSPPAEAARKRIFTKQQRRTLRAAVARIIPAEGAGDWSGADVGADRYIEHLLAGTHRIYAGGPYRRMFHRFQRLSRVKRTGWDKEVRALRRIYRRGLNELDNRAGGDFSSVPPEVQDRILESMDEDGTRFFAALFSHTMEGVYAHPVYGGNRHYRAWREFGYEGDVHGRRFPGIGPKDAAWNRFGGYAPEEMGKPGKGP